MNQPSPIPAPWLRLRNRDGLAISYAQWTEYQADDGYCLVDHDECGPFTITTVWRGVRTTLNFATNRTFETSLHAYGIGVTFPVATYATEAAALIGHRDYVRMVKWTYRTLRSVVIMTAVAGLSTALYGITRLGLWVILK